MANFRSSPRRIARPGLALGAVLAFLLVPTLARADTASTLTIVGTSDVSDSGLMQNLIQPQFHAAFPQFTFKYTGTATGTAINHAEDVNGAYAGESVLIVHAASLENQFVAGGSSDEPFGRAIFTNDFVLAGPSTDPAGVGINGGHDIVQAFADMAAAGAANATTPAITFVSRGGTPGTTVAEHQIWAQVAGLSSPPAGVLLCSVAASLGGGDTPIASGNGVSANGDPCPGNSASPAVLPSGAQLPKWYVATGATQGPNVVQADNCAFASPANTCYVFTDRGTYDFLASGTDPAGALAHEVILTRDNSATAPGGASELINYFHAYIINPSKSYAQVNLTAAQDFLNFLTSPALQAQLRTYLDDTSDPGGAPFVADASPILTATGFPASVNAGATVTVTGSVVNAEPNFPALAGKTVSVDQIAGGLPVGVASATTDVNGHFSVTFAPRSSGSFQVSTGQISMIENSSLSPVFGDLLSPAASAPVALNVQAGVSITAAASSPGGGGVTVAGGLAPAAPDGNAHVAILARPLNTDAPFNEIAGATLAAGASSYALSGALPAGTWQIETTYTDPGQLLAGTSAPASVTVQAATTKPPTAASGSVSFRTITVKKGKLTVTGSLTPGPTAAGAKIELFALKTTAVKVNGAKKKGKKASAAAAFPKVGGGTLAVGKSTFTIHATLKRGHRYVLQLEYLRSAGASFSKLRSIAVH